MEAILIWFAGQGASSLLNYIFLPWIARKILGMRAGLVRTSGFEFFPDRKIMGRFRDLDGSIRNSLEVKLILVGGSKLVEENLNVGNVIKAIFPHPDSPSLGEYAETVGDEGLATKIRSSTILLEKKGVQVRWYPHMINHAVIIADPGLQSGWAQFESVFPYGALSRRHSIVVRMPKYEHLISAANDSFDRMFDASDRPSNWKKP